MAGQPVGILKRVAIIAGLALLAVTAVVLMWQDKLIFFPERLPGDYRFSFENAFEERYFDSPTGNRIHALYFPAAGAEKVILYFHGNAGSLRSWGQVAGDFLPLGYNVLIVDYPGYGKSRGKLSEKKLFADAQYVYDDLRKRWQPDQIIVYGRSIGSGIAARLAHDNPARLLILESPFYSLKDLVGRLVPFLPSSLLRYPFRTDSLFRDIQCPVVIVHGTDDEVIYFGSSLKLQKLFRPGDRLFPVPGGHHNDLNAFPGYQEVLREVLLNDSIR